MRPLRYTGRPNHEVRRAQLAEEGDEPAPRVPHKLVMPVMPLSAGRVRGLPPHYARSPAGLRTNFNTIAGSLRPSKCLTPICDRQRCSDKPIEHNGARGNQVAGPRP